MLSSQESLAQKFVNKWFWLYIFTFLIGPLGYFIKVIISRDLSVEEVGMLYGVISFVTLLSMYNDLGCTESLAYFLPRHIVKNEYWKAKYLMHFVLKIQFISSILIYGTIFLWATWLSTHYFKSEVTEILRIAWLYFIGINILHIATIFFTAVQDTKLQKGTELMRIWWTAIGSAFLFFSDFGNLERYMTIWIIGLSIGIIFAFTFFLRKYYIPNFFFVKKEKDPLLKKEFLRYAFWTFLTANIATLLSQIDMQLVIYLLWTRESWFYSTYLSLIGIPFILLTPIIGFLFPVISELYGRNEEHKIHALISRFWTYFGIIGIWTGIFLFQTGERLSILFFGEKFEHAWVILMYSAPFLVFNFLIQISFQVLAGMGKIRKRAEILAVVLIINIILNLIFIPILWSPWSALAVWLSWLPLYYMSIRATELRVPIFGEISWYINIFTGTIGYGITYILWKSIMSDSVFMDICLAILIYIAIFMLTNRKMLHEAFSTIQETRKKKHAPDPQDIPLPI